MYPNICASDLAPLRSSEGASGVERIFSADCEKNTEACGPHSNSVYCGMEKRMLIISPHNRSGSTGASSFSRSRPAPINRFATMELDKV